MPVEEIPQQVRLYCLLFIAIGIVIFFSSLIQGYGLGKSGEELTQRLRASAFKAMLRQVTLSGDRPLRLMGQILRNKVYF